MHKAMTNYNKKDEYMYGHISVLGSSPYVYANIPRDKATFMMRKSMRKTLCIFYDIDFFFQFLLAQVPGIFIIFFLQSKNI